MTGGEDKGEWFTHPENASELELNHTVARTRQMRDSRLAVLAVMCSRWFVSLAFPAVSGIAHPVYFKTLFVRHIGLLRQGRG